MGVIGLKIKSVKELFSGRHFDREIIILCVRWYLRYKLSLRDLVRSGIPALRLAALCALATVAGKTAAILAGESGAIVVVAAAAPPALIYLWMERSNAMDLIGRAFVPAPEPQTKASEAQA